MLRKVADVGKRVESRMLDGGRSYVSAILCPGVFEYMRVFFVFLKKEKVG